MLLDVHAIKDSQNGGPSSGYYNKTTWIDENNYTHTFVGEWMGEWDLENSKYVSINYANIAWAKDTI